MEIQIEIGGQSATEEQLAQLQNLNLKNQASGSQVVNYTIGNGGKITFSNVPYGVYDFCQGDTVINNFTVDKDVNGSVSINCHSVTFEIGNGGTLAENTVLVVDGKTVAEPQVTPNEGFVIVEWQENGQTFDFANTKITGNITLNAVWLGIGVDNTNVDFVTAKEGYAQPKPKTVTVRNTGNVLAALKLETEGNAFIVGELKSDAIDVNGDTTFTIQPKKGLSEGRYGQNVKVTGTYNDKSVSQVVNVRFVVEGEEGGEGESILNMTVSPETVDFGTVQKGYAQPKPKTVTVRNTGNVLAALKLETEGNAFIVGELKSDAIDVNGDTTFTIQPKKGLSEGRYGQNVKVTGTYNDKSVSQVVNVRFVVEGEEGGEGESILNMTVSPETVDFGTVQKGYAQPKPKTVTVRNTGNVLAALKLETEGNAFIAGELESDAIDVNGQTTFTIQPKKGLSEGRYSQNVTITANETLEKVVFVEFVVEKKSSGSSGGSGGGRTGSLVKEAEKTPQEIETEINVTPSVVEKIEFADVAETDWFYSAVQYVVKNKLMSGTGNQLFEPKIPLTREMLTMILYNMEGNPDVTGLQTSFQDVKYGQWYTNAILWGKANGIVAGYSETIFGLGDRITREQLVTILYRYTKWKGMATPIREGVLEGFADKDNISDYALDGVKWAVTVGIVQGDGTNLHMKNFATRAEVASMFMRYCEDIIAQ